MDYIFVLDTSTLMEDNVILPALMNQNSEVIVPNCCFEALEKLKIHGAERQAMFAENALKFVLEDQIPVQDIAHSLKSLKILFPDGEIFPIYLSMNSKVIATCLQLQQDHPTKYIVLISSSKSLNYQAYCNNVTCCHSDTILNDLRLPSYNRGLEDEMEHQRQVLRNQYRGVRQEMAEEIKSLFAAL